MIPSPVNTLRTILGTAGAITTLVPAARIWAGELPPNQATSLATANAIVLSQAGGLAVGGHAYIDRPRIDVKAYGRTLEEAERISYTVHEFLKAMTPRSATVSPSGTRGRIMGANAAGGVTLLRDELLADAPMALRTYELLVAEIVAP